MALHPDYVELDDLKRHLRIPGNYEGTLNTASDPLDDIPLAFAISAASRSIDTATNRQFGVLDSPAARVYTPEYSSTLNKYIVDVDDFMTTSGLAINIDTTDSGTYDTAVTTYRTYPYNAASDGRPWTRIIFDINTTISIPITYASCEVTAKWGWTSIPTTIKGATLIQAARYFKRRDSAFGIAGSPELGNELRLLSRLDPDVQMMVADYRRWWGAR